MSRQKTSELLLRYVSLNEEIKYFQQENAKLHLPDISGQQFDADFLDQYYSLFDKKEEWSRKIANHKEQLIEKMELLKPIFKLINGASIRVQKNSGVQYKELSFELKGETLEWTEVR
jgi:hypothetical protein